MSDWNDGMLRRSIPLFYQLQDPEKINDAIENSVMIAVADSMLPEEPPEREIRNQLTDNERSKLRVVLRRFFHYGSERIPLTLVYKIAAVLKWHYERNRIKKDAIDVISQISRMMTPEPLIELYVEVPRAPRRDIRLERAHDDENEKRDGEPARHA